MFGSGPAVFRTGADPTAVMAGHSRPKDGVATLAYDPAIHGELQHLKRLMDPRVKPGGECARTYGCTHMNEPACLVHCGPRSAYEPGASRIVSPVNC